MAVARLEQIPCVAPGTSRRVEQHCDDVRDAATDAATVAAGHQDPAVGQQGCGVHDAAHAGVAGKAPRAGAGVVEFRAGQGPLEIAAVRPNRVDMTAIGTGYSGRVNARGPPQVARVGYRRDSAEAGEGRIRCRNANPAPLRQLRHCEPFADVIVGTSARRDEGVESGPTFLRSP